MVNVSGATRFSEADREREHKLKHLDENDPQDWFFLANELAKQNRMDEAKECIDKGMSLEKQDKGKRRK